MNINHAIKLIHNEREEHFTKHKFDYLNDADYGNGELLKAALYCFNVGVWPKNWDTHFKNKIDNKPGIEKFVVGASLIAAHIDRLILQKIGYISKDIEKVTELIGKITNDHTAFVNLLYDQEPAYQYVVLPGMHEQLLISVELLSNILSLHQIPHKTPVLVVGTEHNILTVDLIPNAIPPARLSYQGTEKKSSVNATETIIENIRAIPAETYKNIDGIAKSLGVKSEHVEFAFKDFLMGNPERFRHTGYNNNYSTPSLMEQAWLREFVFCHKILAYGNYEDWVYDEQRHYIYYTREFRQSLILTYQNISDLIDLEKDKPESEKSYKRKFSDSRQYVEAIDKAEILSTDMHLQKMQVLIDFVSNGLIKVSGELFRVYFDFHNEEFYYNDDLATVTCSVKEIEEYYNDYQLFLRGGLAPNDYEPKPYKVQNIYLDWAHNREFLVFGQWFKFHIDHDEKDVRALTQFGVIKLDIQSLMLFREQRSYERYSRHPDDKRQIDNPPTKYRNPTDNDLEDPFYNGIWSVIKDWDINVPDWYEGYSGAMGNHVTVILDKLKQIAEYETERVKHEINKFNLSKKNTVAETINYEREAMHKAMFNGFEQFMDRANTTGVNPDYDRNSFLGDSLDQVGIQDHVDQELFKWGLDQEWMIGGKWITLNLFTQNDGKKYLTGSSGLHKIILSAKDLHDYRSNSTTYALEFRPINREKTPDIDELFEWAMNQEWLIVNEWVSLRRSTYADCQKHNLDPHQPSLTGTSSIKMDIILEPKEIRDYKLGLMQNSLVKFRPKQKPVQQYKASIFEWAEQHKWLARDENGKPMYVTGLYNAQNDLFVYQDADGTVTSYNGAQLHSLKDEHAERNKTLAFPLYRPLTDFESEQKG